MCYLNRNKLDIIFRYKNSENVIDFFHRHPSAPHRHHLKICLGHGIMEGAFNNNNNNEDVNTITIGRNCIVVFY